MAVFASSWRSRWPHRSMLGAIARNTIRASGSSGRRFDTSFAKASRTSAGASPAAISFPPADTTIAAGFAAVTSRDASDANSTSCAPPTPRLIGCMPGKSSDMVVHIRMFEEPRNTTPPGAGGCSRSAASMAAISCSHRVVAGAAGCGADSATGTAAAGATVADSEGFGYGIAFFSSGRAKI